VRVGGTKDPSIPIVKELKPDLVLMNREENLKEHAEAIQSFSRIWVCEPKSPADVPELVREMATVMDCPPPPQIDELERALERPRPDIRERAAYLIWNNPLMVAGGDTYISATMGFCGYENFFQNRLRYPQISLEDLKGCSRLLLSSEPYPFRKRHAQAFAQQLPQASCVFVDGRLFSWYGAATLDLLRTPAEKLIT
jgi:hypothetical protein